MKSSELYAHKGSAAYHLLTKRPKEKSPLVPDGVRALRVTSAAVAGLIARLRVLGWTDSVIKDALQSGITRLPALMPTDFSTAFNSNQKDQDHDDD